MAGSLSSIIGEDGLFTFDLIENMGDAYEALQECFTIILELSGRDMSKISAACKKYRFPDPWDDEYGDDPKEPMQLDWFQG